MVMDRCSDHRHDSPEMLRIVRNVREFFLTQLLGIVFQIGKQQCLKEWSPVTDITMKTALTAYITIQFNIMQYITLQRSTVQYNTAQYNTL